jgi:hypothetical protein
MQDGNHLIARIADSHMPTHIIESEVRRGLGFSRERLIRSDIDFLRVDRHHEVHPRTDVHSCTQNLSL